jgi:hypothetical protein
LSEKKTGQADQPEEKQSGTQYPLGEFYKLVDGYTLMKSQNFWEALLVVETGNGARQIRLYRWRNKNGEWKVDLARFNVSGWDFDAIASKVKEFKSKYMGKP